MFPIIDYHVIKDSHSYIIMDTILIVFRPPLKKC